MPWQPRTPTEPSATGSRRRLKLGITALVLLAPIVVGLSVAAYRREIAVVAVPPVEAADQVPAAPEPAAVLPVAGEPPKLQERPVRLGNYDVNVSAATALAQGPAQQPPDQPTPPPRSTAAPAVIAPGTGPAVPGPGAAPVRATASPAPAAPDAGKSAPEDGSVTVKLIELLVKNGTLSRDQANALLAQARQEVRVVRRAPPRMAAAAPSVAGRAVGPAAARGPTPASPPAGAAPAEAPPPPGTVRVTYVPPTVRAQIAQEVKEQVLAEARDQGWAAPNEVPDWVHRFHLSGDFRMRNERDYQRPSNYPFFPDFNAINNSPNGFDTNSGVLPPLLNTTENRDRFRLRARLNVEADVNDWVLADMRIATGNDNVPISTDQTMGQPGDFSKYAIWLDRAFILLKPTPEFNLSTGRMPNPFWTTPLLFYDQLGFDGVAAQYRYPYSDALAGFVSAGAFPVFNTAFNFGSNSAEKTGSRNAYLLAAQAGAEWKINDENRAKIAAAYFDFSNVEGKFSAPCFNPVGFGSCNTDNTKPAFLQFGNTLFPIRNIVQNPSNPNGPNPEFYGLASRFNMVDLHAQYKLLAFHPIDIVLDGDFVKNLGFNRNDVLAHGPVNNLGANNVYQAGSLGYMGALTVGHELIDRRWDWNVTLAYRYVESDAVLDALTDPYFHLGGTNSKGYMIAGNLGLDRNLWLSARWYSTVQVSGPPFASDSLFLDLNAKF